MSAQSIYVSAPLGSIIRYSDGTPRPPARFKRKLAAWETTTVAADWSGKLSLAICRAILRHRRASRCIRAISAAPASWFSGSTRPFPWVRHYFIIDERPKSGSVRVLDRDGEAAELLHLAADRTAAEAWLASHRYPGAVLEDVTTDEVRRRL